MAHQSQVTSSFLFEIGTEELPGLPLYRATEEFKKLFIDILDEFKIGYGHVETYCTPRRMVLSAVDVELATKAIHKEVRGPSKEIAFDSEGNPTKAALGFAKSQGIEPKDLSIKVLDDGSEYVFAEVSVPSKKLADMLPEKLETLIDDIPWPRSQRWGREHKTFARPIRWIVALLDDKPISFTFADVQSGTTTYGHRLLAPQAITLTSSDFDAYNNIMKDAFVIVSQDKRRELIESAMADVEASKNVNIQKPKSVFKEVVNLVEYPTLMVGEFDKEFLEVPPEILADAMISHQRYFPFYDKNGNLTNEFAIISNGNPEYEKTIVHGNERVVRARLADAKFFYKEDLQQPLEMYVKDLKGVTFQDKLGTMYEKTLRITHLAESLALKADLSKDQVEDAKRAAYLAKADLVTQTVVEFTSLQGIMGGYYAQASGENDVVAQAVAEHYKPRSQADSLPEKSVGKVVALADKIDSICGIFAIDEAPTGSSDPYQVRRQAIGIINILLELTNINLADSINESLSAYTESVDFDFENVHQKICDFFIGRMQVMSREKGAAHDSIEAVSAVGILNPDEFFNRVNALDEARKKNQENFENLAHAYTRAHNLIDKQVNNVDVLSVDETLLKEAAEKKLFDVICKTETIVEHALEKQAYVDALTALSDLRVPIDTFYDEVLVMAEDERVRDNRIALLVAFTKVFENVADIGALAK